MTQPWWRSVAPQLPARRMKRLEPRATGYLACVARNSKPAERPSPVDLSLEARAENAKHARRAVAAEAARAGLSDPVRAAAQVVVTEGFTNAASHAYDDRDGARVEVRVNADQEGITVVVRDAGVGFRPRHIGRGLGSGLGLGLIASLSDEVELRHLPGGGSEVRARIETGLPANQH